MLLHTLFVGSWQIIDCALTADFDKHSSFFVRRRGYEEKKFYNIVHRVPFPVSAGRVLILLLINNLIIT
jgi:hypothetical protein